MTSAFGVKREAFRVFFWSLVLFLACQIGREILMIDTRFALFVHEYVENPYSLFPILYGRPYPDYTSVPVTLMRCSAVLCGGVNYLSIVLPTALCGALGCMLCYLIGRRMVSRTFGLISVSLLIASHEFFNICRMVSIDLYVMLTTLFVFYLHAVERSEERTMRSMPLWVALAAAAGFATRGIIGTIQVAAVAMALDAVSFRWKRLLVDGAICAVIGAALSAGLAYAAFRFHGKEFFHSFIYMQISNRIETGDHGPFYYFTMAAGSFAPTYVFAMVVLASLLIWNRRALFSRDTDNAGWLLRASAATWIVVAVGMSIPSTKHLRYIAPVLPEVAMLSTFLFMRVPRRIPAIRIARLLALALARLIPAALLVITVSAYVAITRTGITSSSGARYFFSPLRPILVLAVLSMASLAVGKLESCRERLLCTLGIMALSLSVFTITVLEPLSESYMSSRAFVAECERIRAGRPMLFHKIGLDGDVNKYMVHVARPLAFVPRDMPADRLSSLPPGSLVVARSDRFKDADGNFEVIVEGRLARRRVNLYRRK